jgi:hypothetical protein
VTLCLVAEITNQRRNRIFAAMEILKLTRSKAQSH